MTMSRRTGLKLTAAMMGAAVLPRIAMAGDNSGTSYRFETEGGEVVIHPVSHASMVIQTPGGAIYVDPVGGAASYAGLPEPALILITHEHGDHYDQPTLDGLAEVGLITNLSVHDMLPAPMRERAASMANGDLADIIGLQIEAVPAYNVTEARLKYHPKGRDNGYVLTIGGRRFYVAGDTEDIPEMRALSDIDVAFLPMNLPYTMTVAQAADAVAEFNPMTVFPYHHRGSDLQEFVRLVAESDSETEITIANWYPNGEG